MIGRDHRFVEPVKVIKSVDDVKKWEESDAYGVRENIGEHRVRFRPTTTQTVVKSGRC